MFDRVTLGFVALILLTSYLYYSINRRIIGEQAKEGSRDFRTKPIDVSVLNPAIHRVRNNPQSDVRRPHQKTQRSRLIANARALVENLAFFRHRGEEHASN